MSPSVLLLHPSRKVHRDLNSHTIVVSVDKSSTSITDDAVGGGFQLKIADFGKACIVQDGPVKATDETTGNFTPPEVILGRPHFTVRRTLEGLVFLHVGPGARSRATNTATCGEIEMFPLAKR